MAVLSNFVRLTPNVPKTLKIEECKITEVVVRDPLWGRPIPKRRLTCLVSEEDGVPVNKVFSTLSEKLASQIWELYRAGVLKEHRIRITMIGEGFAREYQVEVL